jgi:hypothetical protein
VKGGGIATGILHGSGGIPNQSKQIILFDIQYNQLVSVCEQFIRNKRHSIQTNQNQNSTENKIGRSKQTDY